MSVLVSVLIPVFNREQYIEEVLLSALSQTYSNIEVIVVDNCSTDRTCSIVREISKHDDRVKLYRNVENIGPVKNWKECLKNANGEYVKILWSDDLIASTFIEKTLRHIEENSSIGFVFTGVEIFDDISGDKHSAYMIGQTGLYPMSAYIEDMLIGVDYPVSPGCALFRRRDIEKSLIIDIPNKIGSDFSEHAIGNDLLIFLLIAKNYENFYFISEKLSFFRVHKNSITVESDAGKIILLYLVVKSFFLEKYIKNEVLEKKFNAILFYELNAYKNNSLEMRNIQDFYDLDKVRYINYIYILVYLYKKIRLRAKRFVNVYLNRNRY